ncbi:hypothetical protein [uncultured Paludibaculum sp.]|uniref:hypothetical protein n=1 Tax=uncultured Paludibaculum sp. TaxID=1765020 RepID=UPI002AAB65E9|nr:hypothetical protein [uncultured Paludibaculum sp.]
MTDHSAESLGGVCTDRQAALDKLVQLRRASLLISESELIAHCRLRDSVSQPQNEIEILCVPTRNRPDCLRRSLMTYGENAREHGRAIRFLVGDDSDDGEMAARTERSLSDVAAACGQRAHYIGSRHRANLVGNLALQAEVAPDIVTFALQRGARFRVAPGVNRNALLLVCSGAMALMVDDDVFCRTAEPPHVDSGAVLTSRFDPTETWFHADHASAIASVRPSARDILAIHEELLGRSPAECFVEWSRDAGVDLDDLTTATAQSLAANPGRVRLTHVGIAGDCAMGSTRHYLLWSGASRKRLLASRERYVAAMASRQVVRSVTRKTITSGAFCPGWQIGLDAREVLPPFCPVQRNQDGLFVSALRRVCPCTYSGFLPWVVTHAPEPPRTSTWDHMWQSVPGLRTYDIVNSVLAMTPSPVPHASVRDGYEKAGKQLRAIGSLPLREFRRLAAGIYRRDSEARIASAEFLLADRQATPEWAIQDLRTYARILRESLSDGEGTIACDLLAEHSPELAIALSQTLLVEFGRLFQAWPALFEAAAELRRKYGPDVAAVLLSPRIGGVAQREFA